MIQRCEARVTRFGHGQMTQGNAMQSNYSLAEAKQNLNGIVEELKREDCVQLTRRGKPVAVLLSMPAYERWAAQKLSFWDAYEAFRAAVSLRDLDITPEVFQVRDSSPGREVSL